MFIFELFYAFVSAFVCYKQHLDLSIYYLRMNYTSISKIKKTSYNNF